MIAAFPHSGVLREVRLRHRDTNKTMPPAFLDRFRSASARIDHEHALAMLLGIFRNGTIGPRARKIEDSARAAALSEHHSAWYTLFPPLPRCPFPPRTPWEQALRGKKDAYLRRLVISTLREFHALKGPVVNPVADLGTHARSIARSLPDYEVIATDISTAWDRWSSMLYRIACRTQRNYSFRRESIFSPTYGRRPCAVVFFGACGSLTDASLDYAILEGAPLLMCRACCHENIGGCTDLAKYPTLLNYGFRSKNRILDIYKARNSGWYFSDKYGRDAYPRSATARAMSDSAEFHEIARHALDSSVCRDIIDLDRCMLLQDRSYDVLYEQELIIGISRRLYSR